MSAPPLVVVGGPSGAGKTTVGRLLAASLAVPFCDADDLHSPQNIARMRSGVALDDAGRAPWLREVGRWLAAHQQSGGVIACSALARRYRLTLRDAAPSTRFALLTANADQLADRLGSRSGHFMPATLLSDQLATYEPPGIDEPARAFETSADPGTTTERILAWLRADRGDGPGAPGAAGRAGADRASSVVAELAGKPNKPEHPD